MGPCRAHKEPHTLVSLKVPRNPKSEIAISRQFSMTFQFVINESDRFFKTLQIVITIAPTSAKKEQDPPNSFPDPLHF